MSYSRTFKDHQTGGDHYKKKAIQPWEYIDANGLDYFEGNVIKYITRYKDKNGVEDLKKARDYIDYLIVREEFKEDYEENSTYYVNVVDENDSLVEFFICETKKEADEVYKELTKHPDDDVKVIIRKAVYNGI